MARIIASGNLKGGTGKTTIAVNLACALARRGDRVLLLDLDPQETASRWARAGELAIDVVAEPPVALDAGGRWQRRLARVSDGYDVIVLDLPAAASPLLAAALVVVDLILVPITPSGVDVGATAATLDLVRSTREVRHGEKPEALLVPNRVDRHGRYDEATQEAVESLDERWTPPVRFSTDHINAYAAATWVGGYAPDGDATHDIVALGHAVARQLGMGAARASAHEDDRLPLTA